MQVNNQQSPNFTAKMFLTDSLKESARWRNIASKFEAQTAKSPKYELEVCPTTTDALEIVMDRGNGDEFCLRRFVLDEVGTKELMKLSDSKIVKKFKKLLNVVQKRDYVHETITDKIDSVERSIGRDLNEWENFDCYKAFLENAKKKSLNVINADPVFSHYDKFNTYNVFS